MVLILELRILVSLFSKVTFLENKRKKLRESQEIYVNFDRKRTMYYFAIVFIFHYILYFFKISHLKQAPFIIIFF